MRISASFFSRSLGGKLSPNRHVARRHCNLLGRRKSGRSRQIGEGVGQLRDDRLAEPGCEKNARSLAIGLEKSPLVGESRHNRRRRRRRSNRQANDESRTRLSQIQGEAKLLAQSSWRCYERKFFRSHVFLARVTVDLF